MEQVYATTPETKTPTRRSLWRACWRALTLVLLLGAASTAQAQTYCSSGATNTSFTDQIGNVTFNTINNGTYLTCLNNGCNFNGSNCPQGYTDYTSGPSTTVTVGATHSLSIIQVQDQGSYGTYVRAYFDWNDDGDFDDAGEETIGGTSAGCSTVTESVTIPVGATIGSIRMRIVMRESATSTSIAPCGSFSYGETEDYEITVIAGSNCSGTPNAGTVTGISNTCPSVPFNLSATGLSFGTGTSYQWEESPDSVNWTAIIGATNGFVSVPAGITSDTYYRITSTCSISTLSATSAGKKVTVNGFFSCYCAPSHPSCTGDFIDDVVINTLSNTGSGCNGNANGSVEYTAGQFTTTLLRSVTYPLDIKTNSNNIISVWIDWDQSGSYSASEHTQVALSTTANTTTTVQILVPNSAVLGQTGMRIRSRASGSPNGPNDACSTFGSGEREDYVITIGAAPTCSLPQAVGTIGGDLTICSGNSTNLTLTGYTLGSDLQWESSPDNVNWTPITGAINSFYNTGTLTSNTYYRVSVTCSATTLYASSVQVTMNSFNTCYCAPNHFYNCTSSSFYTITGVAINTLNSTSTGCDENAGNNWNQFPASGSTTTNLQRSLTYTLTVDLQNNISAGAWFDFDQSGTYDAAEYVLLTQAGFQGIASVNIPNGAVLGQTGMRIRTSFTNNMTAAYACDAFQNFNGNTEDYIVNIIAAPACSLPVVTGTISGTNNACLNEVRTLVLGGQGLGTSLQWESSTDNITFTPIVGAVNPIYNTGAVTQTMYYRVAVTCSASTVNTSVFTVTLNQFYSCYCAPLHFYDCAGSSFYTIGGVVLNTLNNTSTGCDENSGNNWHKWPTSGSTTTTLQKTLTYSLSVDLQSDFTSAGAWIDFNRDGDYDDVDEYFLLTQGGSGIFNGTVNVIVPASAGTGLTGLRVRGYFSNSMSNTFDCDGSQIFGGNTEDYVINIAPAPACSLPTVAGTIAGSNSVCATETTPLTLSGQGLGTSLQWESSTDNVNFTPIAGAVNSSYTTAATNQTTYYRVAVTCSASTVNTPVFTISINPFYNCYCASAAGQTGDEDIGRVQINTFINPPLSTVVPCASSGQSNQYTNFQNLGPIYLQRTVAYPAIVTPTFASGGTYSNFSRIYIDYNRDGDFSDAGEIVTSSGSGAQGACDTSGGTFIVPIGADTGLTGMRVILQETSSGAGFNPCGTYSTWGETEDYLIRILPAPVCVSPVAVGAISGNTGVCSGQGTTLTLSGQGLGTATQWQISTDNVTFTDVSGATSLNLNTGNLTAARYYRVRVSCPTDTGFTAVHTVSINNFSVCYCTPNYFYACSGFGNFYNWSSVAINTLSDASGCSDANGNSYAKVPTTTTTTTLQLTVGYTLTLTMPNAGNRAGVWFDWNQDGDFTDAGEFTLVTNSYAAPSATVQINVPAGATLGLTGMRVRSTASFITMNQALACDAGQNFYGNTKDYLVTIAAAPLCSVPVIPGTITGANGVCLNSGTTLALTGQGLGTQLLWQVSTDGGVSFADISGATSTSYATGNLSGVRDYRVRVICGSDTGYTPVKNIAINLFYNCYCASAAGNTGDEDIGRVQINTFINPPLSTTVPCASSGQNNQYTNFQNLGPIYLQRTVAYPAIVTPTFAGGGTYGNFSRIYIDYNRDGDFSDAGEIVTSSGSGAQGNCDTSGGTFIVPIGADTGLTGMRVILQETSSGSGFNPCGTFANWGETEDYLVRILPAPPCNSPVAVGAISGNTGVCSGQGTTLSLSGQGLGTATQWQVSTDNVTFTDVSGATSINLNTGNLTAARYYRVRVSCPTDTGFTAVHTVSINNFSVCYCAPNYFYACSGFGNFYNWSSVAINTLSDASGCSNANGNSYAKVPTSTTTTTLLQDVAYNLTLAMPNTGNRAGVWFDWNQDGDFLDASEFYLVTNNYASATTISVLVPVGAALGQTGMRVRSTASFITMNQAFACDNGQNFYGNTKDFVITVDPAPVCTAPPAAGTVAGLVTPACLNSAQTISASGWTLGSTLQWQFSTDNVTFTPIAGATSQNYSFISNGVTAGYYRVAVTCSATTTFSPEVQMTINTPVAINTFPYTQGFQNTWTSFCGTRDAAGPGWSSSPATGNSSWRRDDDGVSANWTNTFGSFSPTGAQSSTRAARFNSYGATAAGDMYLWLDFGSSVADKELSFDFINNGGGSDNVAVARSTDGGATWTTLNTYVSGGTWSNKVINMGALNGNVIIRFRGNFNTFSSDLGIDNVQVKLLTPYDPQITTMTLASGTGCAGSTTSVVTATVRNSGSQPILSGTTLSMRLSAGPVAGGPFTENFVLSSDLLPGATVVYTYTNTLNLSAPGVYNVITRVVWAADQVLTNNRDTIVFTGNAVISGLPYAQSFEGTNGGWNPVTQSGTANNWTRGIPSKTGFNVLNTAGDGAQSWYIGPAGSTGYTTSERSGVVSPCFDFSSLTTAPWVSLKFWIDSEFSWDGGNMQFSTNGGTTWTTVSAQVNPANSMNWYNDNSIGGLATSGSQFGWTGTNGFLGWRHAQIQLPAAVAGQASVRLRFSWGEDGSVVSGNGFAFDHVRVAATAPTATTLRSQDCGYGQFSYTGARSYMLANPVAGVDGYLFAFTTGSTTTEFFSTSGLAGIQAAGLAYNTSYGVRIRTLKDGIYSEASPVCSVAVVTSPSLVTPTTQLRSSDCTYGDFTLNTARNYVGADAIAGADEYTFRFINLSTNTTYTSTPSSSRFINFSTINAANPGFMAYGTTYTVDVEVEKDGVLGAFGPACNIALIAAPTVISTQLRPFDCGAARDLDSGYVIANTVPGGTTYTFNFFAASGAAVPVATLVNSGPVALLRNATPSLQYGTTYYVTVDIDQDGTTALGTDTCLVSTNAITPRLVGKAAQALSIDAYPNPFDREVTVRLSAPTGNVLTYVITDAAGREIARRQSVNGEQFTTGADLQPGIYIMRVYAGDDQLGQVRLVKSGR